MHKRLVSALVAFGLALSLFANSFLFPNISVGVFQMHKADAEEGRGQGWASPKRDYIPTFARSPSKGARRRGASRCRYRSVVLSDDRRQPSMRLVQPHGYYLGAHM